MQTIESPLESPIGETLVESKVGESLETLVAPGTGVLYVTPNTTGFREDFFDTLVGATRPFDTTPFNFTGQLDLSNYRLIRMPSRTDQMQEAVNFLLNQPSIVDGSWFGRIEWQFLSQGFNVLSTSTLNAIANIFNQLFLVTQTTLRQNGRFNYTARLPDLQGSSNTNYWYWKLKTVGFYYFNIQDEYILAPFAFNPGTGTVSAPGALSVPSLEFGTHAGSILARIEESNKDTVIEVIRGNTHWLLGIDDTTHFRRDFNPRIQQWEQMQKNKFSLFSTGAA